MPNTISLILYKTRMTTFIKTKFKKSDDQTNIDKYRVAAYYYGISYYIKINLQENHNSEIHDDKENFM